VIVATVHRSKNLVCNTDQIIRKILRPTERQQGKKFFKYNFRKAMDMEYNVREKNGEVNYEM
jgi:hypothetical protein